ncbi:MAG TPA: GMC family oxidoreductase N-terminal domain-containing protein [Allosphingosinicella sp.]|nr:GMC family oxidoreductase N-terminal domain-containing protein [Allosphingosinicella sp.]
MADPDVLQLPPVKAETGVAAVGGVAARRFIHTDEGRGGPKRHLIYEAGADGLRFRAAGATRDRAAAKLGPIAVAWAPAGEAERNRVAARRDAFLRAYVEALFDGPPKRLTVDQVIANAREFLQNLPKATRDLLNFAMRVLEVLLGPDFADLDVAARQRRILDESSGLFRDLGRLRTIFYASYFRDPATFEDTGFKPPPARTGAPKFSDRDDLKMTALAGGERFDWVVIGSGAGGAAAAAALARAGKSVIVLERGSYFAVKDLRLKDTEQYARIYVAGGLQTTADRTISVMQASAIGGSSLINNCICFRLAEDGWTHPDARDVIASWGSKFDIHVDRDKLDRAFLHIEEELGVHEVGDEQAGANGRHLLEAWKNWLNGPFATAADVKAPFRAFKMNFGKQTAAQDRHCWGCGYCNSGCAYDRKNTVAQTLLVRAQEHGAKLAPNAEVVRVVLDDPPARRARSVEVLQGGRRRIVAANEGVVVAAGVGASTEVLRRSGIRDSQLGRKVTCNLACTIPALMPKVMNSWQGAQMATYVDRGTHLIESWFHPPATFAAAVGGWFDDHLSRMANYSRLVCMGLVMPTTDGEVIDGQLSIRLGPDEVKRLRRHVEDVVRLHFAGGAEEVYLPDQTAVTVRPDDPISDIVRRTFAKASDFVMVTAHPQGGNPMSRTAQSGTVGTNLRVHGCRNLFVADASIFPSSIRVNPQVAIMAFAHARFEDP